MSQLILDEHVTIPIVLPALRKWISVQRIQDIRPNELILDDRIPQILLTQRRPAFITIDKGFWNRALCNPGYCILYFDLRDEEQEFIPGLTRKLFHVDGFQTRSIRMGKVVRVRLHALNYWQWKSPHQRRIRF
jgi:hypothetical protein